MSWQATAWVSTVEAGGPSGKLLLYALANYADEHGRCWPSDARLQADTELSERAIRDWKRKLEDAGLMVVERRRTAGGTFQADEIRLSMGVRPPANPAGGEDATTGKQRRDHRQMVPPPPANGAVPPTPPYKAEPSEEPSGEPEREGAGEPGQGSGWADAPTAERPGTADFEKRVARFCNGRGYLAGPWPDWDTASFGWIARQFGALSSAEMEAAERWRDPYLFDIASRKAKAQPVGVFLRDKAWEALDPVVFQRFEKHREARLKPEERAKPDGWSACLGPVGMAWLVGALLDGPADASAAAAIAGQRFAVDQQLRDAWPSLWRWRALLRQKGGVEFAPRWHALKGAMEAVVRGTDLEAAWRRAFEARQWPWLVDFERNDVVYLPAGGPDRLDEFEQAIEAGRHDADQRQAAE